jgi:hypothetical protein
MNPDAVQHGLVAKRGLPADLHDPIPPTRWQPVSRNSGPIARETPGIVISKLMGIDTTANRCTATRPQDDMIPDPRQTPFDERSLTAVAGSSNSRFFTDCYHVAAVFAPPHRLKPRLDPAHHTRLQGSVQALRSSDIVDRIQPVRRTTGAPG